MESERAYKPREDGINNLKIMKQMVRDHVSKGAVKPKIKLLE